LKEEFNMVVELCTLCEVYKERIDRRVHETRLFVDLQAYGAVQKDAGSLFALSELQGKILERDGLDNISVKALVIFVELLVCNETDVYDNVSNCRHSQNSHVETRGLL
jgi:hypothetical protein